MCQQCVEFYVSFCMDHLLEQGLELDLMAQLKHFFGRDLLSVRLVCKSWNAFVQRWVYGTVSGKKPLRKTLAPNWRRTQIKSKKD